MIKSYLKTNISDFAICVAAACAFTHTILSGFYTPEALQSNIALLIGITVVVNILLFVGAYNNRTVIAAVIAFVLLAVTFIVVSRNAGLNALSDNEDNRYLYFVLLTLSSIGIFLLSRSRIGAIILFALGTLILCVIRFLYETNHIVPFLLFIACAGAIYLRSYYRSSSNSAARSKTAHIRSAISAVLVMAVALGLASGAYFGIVKPLNPPAQDLKLITHYMSLETLEKMGIADNMTVPDDKLKSDKTNDNENKTNAGNKDNRETSEGADKPNDDLNNDKTKPQSLDSSRNAFFRVITYLFSKSGWWILPLIFVVAIIASILIKLYRRKRWLKKQSALSPEAQVKSMYVFYMRKLRRMKIRKPSEDTLFEFVRRRNDVLSRFDTAAVGFSDLTEIYARSLYGKEATTQNDAGAFRAFHAEFYKKCRDYLGGFGYAVRFFAL
jgi:hypothetical protein